MGLERNYREWGPGAEHFCALCFLAAQTGWELTSWLTPLNRRVENQALLLTFPRSELLITQSPHVQGNPRRFSRFYLDSGSGDMP